MKKYFFLVALKYFIDFNSSFIFHIFVFSHIHKVVLTLFNAVKLDVKNNSVALMLPNFVNINAKIYNVGSTLFNVLNFKVDGHNIVSMLVWHCPMSRGYINLAIKQC